MTDTSPVNPESATPATAGQWLRAVRLRQGVHLAVLSAALKVPVKSLEHLEADRHEELPGATFVRALALSVCRQLRVEPGPVLALLPERDAQVAAVPPTLQAALPAGSGLVRHDHRLRFYVFLVVLMLVLIAGLLFWPARSSLPSLPAAAPGPAVTTVPAQAPIASVQERADAVMGAVTAPVVSAVSTASASSASSAPGPLASALTSPPSAGATMSAPAPAVLAPGQAPSAPSTLPPPTLYLQAAGECWVEVRDARGQVVLSLLMQAGQSQSIHQPAPLRVVLGNAAVMQAQVRGQRLDLAQHTKITVARFEVQP